MNDEVWKGFFTDMQTERAMNSSEVWRNYSRAELTREHIREKRAAEERKNFEDKLFSDVSSFQKELDSNPKLKAHFKRVASFIHEHPEVRDKVDPNFLSGLNMINFEE